MTLNELTNKFWCDKCRKVYNINISQNNNICPKCNTKSLHYLISNNDNIFDEVIINEENFKDVLPKDLHYAYLQMKSFKMTFSVNKLATYSISKNSLRIHNKWLKSKE